MGTAKVRIEKREATWRRVVRGHNASGMSIRVYCVMNRVKEPALYWWRAELARRDAAKPMSAFVPVTVETPVVAGAEGISIELRGGRMLRLPAMAVAQVAELVRAIEGAL